mmetsp:Transcript_27122/g.63028  ORF Transcript_27122/g.63028 Transcript_27122/m.63028 type:complete len:308 (+) Transcript_27122:3-926(+)
MFDLETHQWTALPSVKAELCEGIAAVAVGRCIVVCGGNSDVVEVFDTESQTWSSLQNLPSKRRHCAAGLVGDRVLVAGGYGDGEYLDSVVSLQVGDVVSIPRLLDVPNVLGRRKRKAALEKWVKEAEKMRLDCLAEIETATARANAWHTKEKREEDARHAKERKEEDERYQKKLGEFERIHEKKVEKVENDYRQRLENLATSSGMLADEVDDKLKDAKEQIEDLKNRLEGRPDPLLCCPITGDIMKDPVVAADGHTYERSAIEEIFAQTPSGQEVMSPASNTPLTHRVLMPNMVVQAMVARYKDKST